MEIIKRNLSYQDIGHLLDRLTLSLIITNQTKKFDCVLGIPRGGLPIATHMSYHLNIPIIFCETNKEFDKLVEQFNISDRKLSLLIVDDVADSGTTLNKYKEMVNNLTTDITFATLHYKLRSIIIPNIFVETVQNYEWLVYPWESIDTPIDKSYMYDE